MKKQNLFVMLFCSICLIGHAAATSYAPLQPYQKKTINKESILNYSLGAWKSKNSSCSNSTACATITFEKSLFLSDLFPYYSLNDGPVGVFGGRGLAINLVNSSIDVTIYEAEIQGINIIFKLKLPDKVQMFNQGDITSVQLIANPNPGDISQYTIDSTLRKPMQNGIGISKLPVIFSDEEINDIYLAFGDSVNPLGSDFVLPNVKVPCSTVVTDHQCAKVDVKVVSDSKYFNMPDKLLGRVINLDTSSFTNLANAYPYGLYFIPFDYIINSSSKFGDDYTFFGAILKPNEIPSSNKQPVLSSPIILNLDPVIASYPRASLGIMPPYNISVPFHQEQGALPVIAEPGHVETFSLNNQSNFIVKQDWFSPSLKMSGSTFDFSVALINAVIEISEPHNSDVGNISELYFTSPDLFNGRELIFNEGSLGKAVVYDTYSYPRADGVNVIDLYVKLTDSSVLSATNVTARVIKNTSPQLQSFFYADSINNMGAKLTADDSLGETPKWEDQNYNPIKLPHFSLKDSQCPYSREQPEEQDLHPEGCFIIDMSKLKKLSDYNDFTKALQSKDLAPQNLIFKPTTTAGSDSTPYSMYRYHYDTTTNQYDTDYKIYNIYDLDEDHVYAARYSVQNIQTVNDNKEKACTTDKPCLYYFVKSSRKGIVYDPDQKVVK